MSKPSSRYPTFSSPARIALLQAIRDAEPGWRGHIDFIERHEKGDPPDMYAGAATVLRQHGFDIASTGKHTAQDVVLEGRGDALAGFVSACVVHVHRLEGSQFYRAVSTPSGQLRARINEICKQDANGFILTEIGWRPNFESDAEALYRALLGNAEDAADFRQGDVQIEMVVSSIQERLASKGTVLVDYGVGLGRLLAGLGTADRFRHAEYVGVDEPIDAKAMDAGKPFGGSVRFQRRDTYLTSPARADVVVLLNTLHHIPFAELGSQFAAMLTSIEAGGLLLLHEMGAHVKPEAYNVPWRYEHIVELLRAPGLDTNGRSTTSKSGVPLTHALVRVTGRKPRAADIQQCATRVWDRMKAEAVDDIRRLYAASTPDDYLAIQRAVIVNANLDVNRP